MRVALFSRQMKKGEKQAQIRHVATAVNTAYRCESRGLRGQLPHDALLVGLRSLACDLSARPCRKAKPGMKDFVGAGVSGGVRRPSRRCKEGEG
jgi:hypothetical protein